MPCARGEADSIIAATRRWLERAVIGLNLCPFAKAAYVKQQIRFAVTAAETRDELLAELAQELDLLARANPQQVDTTLLIHPRVLTGFIDYHLFLPDANAAIRRASLDGIIQVATFHPEYEFAGSKPDDIENCTNRSPYPMLHLLRESSVARAVAAFPDAATIVDRNIAMLRELGHEGWRRLWLAQADQGT